jgi:hypothetical protein
MTGDDDKVKTMRTLSPMRVATLLLAGTLGCGLISSDITKVTFELPAKHYTFNSQGLTLPPGANQKVTCGAGGMIATCPAPLACDDGVCSAHVPATTVQKMDLSKDVPALAGHQSIADVTLERLHYDVVSTANVAIPAITLYLAPQTVTDPNDPSATKFGTVPAIPAGMSVSGEVEKEPNADAIFTMFGHDLANPFNLIATTTIVIPTGTTPMGMVDLTINGTIAAKISL